MLALEKRLHPCTPKAVRVGWAGVALKKREQDLCGLAGSRAIVLPDGPLPGGSSTVQPVAPPGGEPGLLAAAAQLERKLVVVVAL